MNSFKVRLILICISAFVYAGILISMPFRTKKILAKAGKIVVPVKKKQLVIPVLIIICSAVLIALLLIRDFGFAVNVVVCLVAILGVSMGSAEAALNNCSGVYESGLIGGGHYLPFSEIYAVPADPAAGEDHGESGKCVLRVVTNKKGTVSFLYSSPEECDAVTKTILKLAPNLNPLG